ncbi:MAG: SMC-Scp complex subunit ScpB, partial [Bdellovibrionales bacterium]|nr:SMC-Scp complex subunit ScpB [Bdellovibrionales bacterium]
MGTVEESKELPESEDTREEISEEFAASDNEFAELLEGLEEVERQALVEAILYTNGAPLTAGRIAEVTTLPKNEVVDILESIALRHSLEESGVELIEIQGKYQLRSKAAFGPFIQRLKTSRPRRLSPPALETLAIVAYRQPIVKSDVEKIRGVDAAPTLKTLLDRGFIRIVGHQPSVGQPALYGTTDRFLEVFGLKSLSELPTLRDLQLLEAEPGDESASDEVDEEVMIEEESE